jgi:2-methylaconitate cis-trans-isomerase PrpF
MPYSEEQLRIPAVLMRGGTSRGLYVMRAALPSNPVLRDRVILKMYGSPDIRQIDGIGGADALTSKLAIIGPPTRRDADVDYTFAQVSITDNRVDYSGNCGNISSGVGPFAIDQGLVDVVEPATTVRIHQTNTRSIIVAEVPVANGRAAVQGDYGIDGVPGTGARIGLDFSDSAGGVTGRLLPTGSTRDTLDVPGFGRIEASIVDAGNPCVFVRAEDMGIRGTECADEIDADRELNERIERIRGGVAARLGFVQDWQDAAKHSPYIPFLVMVSPPAKYRAAGSGRIVAAGQVDVVARLVFMLKMHKTFPVSGTVCTGAAARIPGTLVHAVTRPEAQERPLLLIGHPAGVIDIQAAVELQDEKYKLTRASIGRTARRIMEGYVLVPASTMQS